MNVIISIVSVLIIVFVLSSLVGLFQARRDIKRHKNEDNTLRRSRKEVINEKLKGDINISNDSDVLSAISSLSPQEQELFKSELYKKLNEGSVK